MNYIKFMYSNVSILYMGKCIKITTDMVLELHTI